jgi:hypothetical protein
VASAARHDAGLARFRRIDSRPWRLETGASIPWNGGREKLQSTRIRFRETRDFDALAPGRGVQIQSLQRIRAAGAEQSPDPGGPVTGWRASRGQQALDSSVRHSRQQRAGGTWAAQLKDSRPGAIATLLADSTPSGSGPEPRRRTRRRRTGSATLGGGVFRVAVALGGVLGSRCCRGSSLPRGCVPATTLCPGLLPEGCRSTPLVASARPRGFGPLWRFRPLGLVG